MHIFKQTLVKKHSYYTHILKCGAANLFFFSTLLGTHGLYQCVGNTGFKCYINAEICMHLVDNVYCALVFVIYH